MKRLLLAIIFTVALAGCVQSVGNPIADATNNLISTKSNVIEVFKGIATGCQQGLIPVSQCQKAEALYKKVPAVYQAAADSLTLAETSGDMTKTDENSKALTDLLSELTAIKGGK